MSFQAMLDEIESGNVVAVVVKDMSRLGRDYLKVGMYMETFRKLGVRLIAVNDGADSSRDDDFTPFRNIMNEWYARDTSKKICPTFKAKGESGKRVASSTITHILGKSEYCGHTVNFKTRKHFKDKKSHYVSKDQWLIFENTHEAIIDEETFNNVQKLRANIRRYPDG